MKNQITLDFCVWLQRNFDEILAEGPEWHGNLEQHLSRAQAAAVSSKPIAPVQKQAEEPDWDFLRKFAQKHNAPQLDKFFIPLTGRYK